jgi:hypothetical protein
MRKNNQYNLDPAKNTWLNLFHYSPNYVCLMCKYLYKSESMWLSQQTQQVPLFTCPHLDPSSDVSAPNPTNRLIYNE